MSQILPEKIEAGLLRLLALDDEINTAQAGLKQIEARVTAELTGAKDVKTGKLVLTNDKQREAAVAEYLAADAAFLDGYKRLKAAQAERSTVQAALERIRIEVKYELLELEAKNQIAALKLAEAIWHARQGPDSWTPERIKAAVASGLGGPVGPAPEFFRGPGLHIIEDRDAGGLEDVEDCPF